MRILASLLCLLLVALTACGPKEDDNTLVIWHSYRGDEAAVLKEVVDRFVQKRAQEGRPQPVRVVGLPNDSLPNKLSNAIPRGNGPDLFIFGHDRLGDWVETGLLEPISFWASELLADRFVDGTLEPLTYRGDLYGLPLAYKCLALFYDTKLVDEPPATTEDLIALGKAVRAKGKDYWGIAYQIDTLYSHAPWMHGYGASVYTDDVKNPDTLNIDTDAMAKSMLFVRRMLRTEKIFPEEATSALITSLFLDHKLAFVVSGPWFMAELAKHDSWKVAVLPTVSETNQPMRPYMGVEGLMLSAHSKHKQAAFELMTYLTSDPESLERMDKAGQIVANRKAYQRELKRPELEVFQKQAAFTVPMSNRPHMNRVWAPMQRALSNVIVHNKDPHEILKDAIRQIEK